MDKVEKRWNGMKKPEEKKKALNAYGARTKYVAGIMKKIKWKDRNYVEELLLLEAMALGERPCNFVDSMALHNKEQKFPFEYLMILKELNPKERPEFMAEMAGQDRKFQEMLKKEYPRKYLEFLRRNRTARKMEELEKKQELESDRREKKRWLASGGKR